MQGQVIRTQSGFFTVKTQSGEEIVCQIRGRLKQGPRAGDMVALGDRVEISLIDKQTGLIEAVQPRERLISRMSPSPQGEYQQIIIANPDQACLVFACEEPAPRFGMLDRYLVIAEQSKTPAVVVANKVDLVGRRQAEEMFGLYAEIGYPVIYTSAQTGEGIEELHAQLMGKVSVLTGPSGVGKSSLLNAIQPGLGLEVSRVSSATTKGRHTTVVRALFPLKGGGYVGDTPGLKALALWDIEPEELDAYFPELRDRVQDCQFSDCTHVHEPGCAILQAVQAGDINPERYQSYLRMRFGDEE
ncbi:MAG TPA: ribosome small subunit-dependent GTPase A [Anaerolineales bacterium]|nr:ribosome small subunit-dependent GTPase A [Anaerolineales bacterium]